MIVECGGFCVGYCCGVVAEWVHGIYQWMFLLAKESLLVAWKTLSVGIVIVRLWRDVGVTG